jgi:Tfp pilus assembly protein PilN
MTIDFDHRPLRPLDAAAIALRGLRLHSASPGARLAFVGVCALTIVLGGLLSVRAHAAQNEARTVLARLDETNRESEDARRLLGRIAAMRITVDDISRAARSGDRAADELAQVGNALPAHVWIARFRRDGDAIVIEGGARSVEAVGTAIDRFDAARSKAELTALTDASRPDGAADIRYSARVEHR